jgi:predicted nucleotidyltransferase
MIEVELEKRERNHPALSHPFWFGRRARFWDFDGGFIEHESEGNTRRLDVLEAALDEMLSGYPVQRLIKDYLICGSFAYGTQRYWSDFDIQLSAQNKKSQKELEAILSADKENFGRLVTDTSCRLKISLDVRFQSHNQEEKSECFSLRKRRLYNRKAGEAKPANFRRRWNKETEEYEPLLMDELPQCRGPYWDDNGDELNADS